MIPIFIGTSDYEDSWIERILAYTLLKNTQEKINITWLRPKYFPDWNKVGWGTPFTNFRYAVPHLMNYKGKAIYMDSDQINFRNIAHLYETDLEGRTFGLVWDALMWNGAKWRDTPHERGFFCDSVMLIDCEKAGKLIGGIDKVKNAKYGFKMDIFDKLGCPDKSKGLEQILQLNPRWNSFEGNNTSFLPKGITDEEDYRYIQDLQPRLPPDEIWHLHLTGLSSQMWHPTYNPWAKTHFNREDLLEIIWELNRQVNMITKREEFLND
jgi:hypothetical protein